MSALLTLLAPSDEAFNALPQDIRDRLLAPENRALLTDLLLYHAVPGLYPTERLLKAKVRNYTISAIEGSSIEINKRMKTGEIDIAGAKIVRSETASDGIIHVIDKVLIPPAVMAALTAPPSMEPCGYRGRRSVEPRSDSMASPRAVADQFLRMSDFP